MSGSVFSAAEILLPRTEHPETWSVIACDQFSSEPEYWRRAAETVGDRPSTLHMIVPEAFLEGTDLAAAAAARGEVMASYLAQDVFCAYPGAFVYVERTTSTGKLRRGLVGKLDLEAYDYRPGTTAPVRASEKTVVERLPARITVRERACLELPHVMMLADDPDGTIVEPLTAKRERLPLLYDFGLMEGGGHLAGRVVAGKDAEAVQAAVDAFADWEVQMVIGDGNHSLAAAKACWDALKKTLSPAERETHPARWALVELNNVYDAGIGFEAIHRVLFGVEPEHLVQALRDGLGDGPGSDVRVVWAGGSAQVRVPAASFGGTVAALQDVLDRYLAETGCGIDYIHDDAAASAMAEKPGAAAIFLPAMDKADLFRTVERDGVFPRKSFSIGHARDKRYYMECRRIR